MADTIPSECEVRTCVGSINDARLQPQSYKASLYFYYPRGWKAEKLGAEGWILHTTDLGEIVNFSIFSVDADPQYGSSFEDLKKLSETLFLHQGIRFLGAKSCKIAGKDAVECRGESSNGNQLVDFRWLYKGGEYSFRASAPSGEHLERIRPAIDAFKEGFSMEFIPWKSREYKQMRPAFDPIVYMVSFIVFFAVLIIPLVLLWRLNYCTWNLWVKIVLSILALPAAILLSVVTAAIFDEIVSAILCNRIRKMRKQ